MAERQCAPTTMFSFFVLTVIAVLGVHVHVGAVWSGEPCPAPPDYFGEEVTLQHRLDTGRYRCCKLITCQKGTYAVPCEENDPSSTSCKECPDGKFMHYVTKSSDMLKCKRQNSCSQRGQIKIDEGTIVSDAVCGCDLEQGYTKPIGVTNTYCMGPKGCPAGEELSLNHSCQSCNSGTFKPKRGYSGCQYWTNCEQQGLQTATFGSSTTNSVCEIIVSTEETSSTSPVTTDHNDGSASRSTDWSMVIWIFVGLGVFTIVTCLVVILIKRKCIQIPTFWNSWNKKSGTDSDQPSSTGTEPEEISPGPSAKLLQPNGPTQADPPSQSPPFPLTGAPQLNANAEEDGLLCPSPPPDDLPEVDGPNSDEQSMDVEEEQKMVNDHVDNERTPPSVSSPMQTTEVRYQQQSSPSTGSLEGTVTKVYHTTYNINAPATFNNQSTTTNIESANACQILNSNKATPASERVSDDATDSTAPSDTEEPYTVESSESDSEELSQTPISAADPPSNH